MNKDDKWYELISWPFLLVFSTVYYAVMGPFILIEKFIEPRSKGIANFATAVLFIIFLIFFFISLRSTTDCPAGTRWVPLPVADCL